MAQARLRRVMSPPEAGSLYLAEHLHWLRELGDRETWPDSEIPGLEQHLQETWQAAEQVRLHPPADWTGADWSRHADSCDRLRARLDAVIARRRGSGLVRSGKRESAESR